MSFVMFALKFLFLHIVCTTIRPATAADIIIVLPTTTVQPSPRLPPGYVHFSNVETAFKLYTNRSTWSRARETCITEGARLAVIDTSEKLEIVKNMRLSQNLLWTGIYRESRRSEWRAVDGDRISSDLPHVYSTPLIFGDCVAIIGSDSSTRLRTLSCDSLRQYACEIPDAK